MDDSQRIRVNVMIAAAEKGVAAVNGKRVAEPTGLGEELALGDEWMVEDGTGHKAPVSNASGKFGVEVG
jgi:hypothetical protein